MEVLSYLGIGQSAANPINTNDSLPSTGNSSLYYGTITVVALAAIAYLAIQAREAEKSSKEKLELGFVWKTMFITMAAVETIVVTVVSVDLISRIFNLPWKILDKIFPERSGPSYWDDHFDINWD